MEAEVIIDGLAALGAANTFCGCGRAAVSAPSSPSDPGSSCPRFWVSRTVSKEYSLQLAELCSGRRGLRCSGMVSSENRCSASRITLYISGRLRTARSSAWRGICDSWPAISDRALLSSVRSISSL